MAEILAEVIRNGRVESRHRGQFAVVDPSGNIVAALGEINTKTYMRSAAKPVQVMPLLESGAAETFEFTDRELAVIIASHNSEEFHIEAVRSIQQKAGLTENDLQCGFHLPMYGQSAKKHLLGKKPKSPLYNNCSGKHSGMLALAKYKGWPLDTYLSTDHPVQVAIKNKIALFAGLDTNEIETGIDGCSAPVFYLPIRNMAQIFANISDWKIAQSERVFNLMSQIPEMIAGTGRFDTAVMQAGNGRFISKIGAEGVRCFGIKGEKPLGIALKIEDGNTRTSAVVLLEILRQLGLISQDILNELREFQRPVLKNCAGIEIGEIRAVF